MRFAVGLVLALAMVGPCAAGIKVEVPAPVTVPALEPGAQVQAVSFSRMAGSIAEGEVIAEVGNLISCQLGGQPFRWRSSMNRLSDPDFERIFREEFAKAGLKVSGDQTNLFEQDKKNSDLQVGALLTDLQAKICYGPYMAYAGGAGTINVEWQIYSASAGKVIARIPTVSGASGLRSNNHSDLLVKIIQQSFAETVRQLEANPQFREIVLSSRSASAAAPQPPQGALRVDFHTEAKPIPLKDATSGTVVVYAGAGVGSGVLISANGYILTNHHVAGDSGPVRIRWSDRTETVGEVVRADRRRDVALIKVASPKGQPLALRPTPVDLGEKVYAIGAPLGDELQNTVTSGIVSAVRMMDGESFIQSDTPVTYGNSGGPLLDEKGAVVGLTDLGYDASLGSTLNFFIPINDALKVLDLTPTS